MTVDYGFGFQMVSGYSPDAQDNAITRFLAGDWAEASMRTVQVPTSVYWPAKPSIPAIESAPPGKSQVIKLLNAGWNTWARTVDTLELGKFIQFSVAPNVGGVFLGLGVKGKDGHGPHTFTHGLLTDLSGVWVFESGVQVHRIRTSHEEVSKLRICRQADNSIVYLVTTGAETLAHVSEVPPTALPLYGYGYLYLAGDTLLAAGMTTGEVQYGSA